MKLSKKVIFSIADTVFIGLAAFAALTISGCSPADYKTQADKQVYNIIDKNWDPNYGEKVNYRISDVPVGPSDINVPLAVPASGIINLSEAVAIATEYNRQYQDRKEQLYETALALTFQQHLFEPIFNASASGAYTNAGGFETIDAGGNAGFGWLLGTGTRISSNIAVDWVKFLSGDRRTTLASILSANITQPLLRGANPVVVRENLTQAERNVVYDLRSFSLYRQDFLIKTVSNYYRVLQALDAVQNAKATYDNLKKSQERIEMLAQAGQLPNFEVDQARQQTLQVYDQYIEAVRAYESALDDFKFTLSLPITASVQLDQNDLQLLTAEGISEPNYSITDAIATAIEQRLDLATAADKVDDAKRKIIVAEDHLKAQLDIFASGSAASEDRKVGDINFDQGTYSVGANLDLPIDRVAERNAYRVSLINLNQEKRSYSATFDNVVLGVRQSYRQVQETATRFEIQQNSKKLAERRVENVTLLLLAGRKGVTTRDLLDAQSDLLQAQNAVTTAIVNHTIARLSFFGDIGVLKVRPDGMWQRGVNNGSSARSQ